MLNRNPRPQLVPVIAMPSSSAAKWSEILLRHATRRSASSGGKRLRAVLRVGRSGQQSIVPSAQHRQLRPINWQHKPAVQGRPERHIGDRRLSAAQEITASEPRLHNCPYPSCLEGCRRNCCRIALLRWRPHEPDEDPVQRPRQQRLLRSSHASVCARSRDVAGYQLLSDAYSLPK
jgi:hypothetical protein